jgi:hypothetical protein
MTRLDEIRARLAAASPGPWERGANYLIGGIWILHAGPEPEDRRVVADLITRDEDSTLIGHAPADLAYLLDEVDRTRAALVEAQILIDRMYHADDRCICDGCIARRRAGEVGA